jgi:hypothetical protein
MNKFLAGSSIRKADASGFLIRIVSIHISVGGVESLNIGMYYV